MTRALLGTAPAGATNAVRWQDLLAQNTATMPTNGWYLPSANTLGVATNGVQRGTISSAGLWSIAANLTVGTSIQATGNNSAGWTGAGAELLLAGGSAYVQGYNRTTSALIPLGLQGSTISLNYGASATTGLSISATGNVSIAAPSSSSILTLNSTLYSWYSSNWTTVDINLGAGIYGDQNAGVGVVNNLYLNTSGSWTYKTAGSSNGGALFLASFGAFNWYTAPVSGAANSAATLTTMMSLSNAGVLSVPGGITGNASSATNAAQVTASFGRTDATAYPACWIYNSGTGVSQLYSCAAVSITSSTGTLNASDVNLSGTGSLLQVGSTKYSSWGTGTFAIDIGAAGGIHSDGSGTVNIVNNLYVNNANWFFKQAGYGSVFQAIGGTFQWFTSNASGSSGGAGATLTQIMALGNAGNLNTIGGFQTTGYVTSGWTGAGVEVGFSGGNGLVQSYNRSTSAYAPLVVTGSTLSLGGTITLASVATQTSAPAAGGASALPATPKGYFAMTIGSYAAKIPYY